MSDAIDRLIKKYWFLESEIIVVTKKSYAIFWNIFLYVSMARISRPDFLLN